MCRVVQLLLAALLLAASKPLRAQETRTDSAAALLRAATVLEAEGETRLARELLRYLARRFPETTAGQAAVIRADQLPAELTGLGRSGFLLYHTLYGAFLGVAIPAALDADHSEPYGVGLLIGAPLGFFASRAYAGGRNLTDGQAGIISFASYWGTWQGIGWRAVLDLGNREVCSNGFCFDEGSDTAPWVAAIVGGLAGMTTGVLAARSPVRPGTSTLIYNASLWGTWYGIATGLLADAEDDGVTAAALVGGNLSLLAALPLARSWRPSPVRVRTISALGLAGGFAGLGASLVADVNDTQGVVALVASGTTIGLLSGFVLTRGEPSDHREASAAFEPALVTHGAGWRVGLPLPVPALIPAPGERRGYAPGLRLLLLAVRPCPPGHPLDRCRS